MISKKKIEFKFKSKIPQISLNIDKILLVQGKRNFLKISGFSDFSK